jgi:hypothetical protein
MNIIARAWEWLMALGRRQWTVRFDRTEKIFPDTRLLPERRRGDRRRMERRTRR